MKLQRQIKADAFQCGWYRGIFINDEIRTPSRNKIFRDGVFCCTKALPGNRKEPKQMEFMTGIRKKDTTDLKDLTRSAAEGAAVKTEGTIHTIRDMGEVAFVILRRRDGLLQCVFEEGSSGFELKLLKEGDCVEVQGTVRREERAPHGVELRLSSGTGLSEPAAPMPLAISKWKMNTSLEAKLNMRSIALRNVRERAKFRIQEGIVRGFRDFLYSQGFT